MIPKCLNYKRHIYNAITIVVGAGIACWSILMYLDAGTCLTANFVSDYCNDKIRMAMIWLFFAFIINLINYRRIINEE